MARIGYKIGRQIVGSHELLKREHGSECVASLEYIPNSEEDPEHGQVICEFVKRGTYAYFDFDVWTFAEWNSAGSRGIYFNLYVKGNFPYERIA
jgi:hypothetical protein